MSAAPRILFVPVSGPGGAGEYFRCLAFARAAGRRWPGASISFVMSRAAPQVSQVPYPVHLVDRSPTRETAAVARILAEVRPDVVVFDSAGRVAQCRRARELGARTVFVSSRPSTRRRGFALRRLWALDQHWIVAPRFLGGTAGPLERLKLALAPHCTAVFLEVIHEPVDEEGTRALEARLGIDRGRYVVVCPGGGGHATDGRDPSRVYLEAAARVGAATGLPVVAVLGSPAGGAHFGPGDSPAGVHVVDTLPNGVLMGLLHGAHVGIVNGGSLLVQSIAASLPCVAAPISDDQPGRIARCAAAGLVRAAPLDAAALADEAAALARPPERAALAGRLAALSMANGLDVAVDSIGRLLAGPR
ncbi:MAG: hypothetical protein U1F08_02720 [Steroidobacteraceae bacterium]